MRKLSQVEDQLKRIGCNFRFWGRPEIRELPNILMEDEVIAGCTNGRYEGGFAMLCVTNHRLLLIDRKPIFLTMEDIRFDMIAEIDFAARLMDSTVHIQTPNRKLVFTGWNHHRMRKILNYTQQRVMEIRQHYLMAQHQPQPQMQPQQQPQQFQTAFQPQQPQPQPQQQFQAPAQPTPTPLYSAPLVGGMALQGNAGNVGLPLRMAPYPNAYTKVPLMMRRRRLPRFY